MGRQIKHGIVSLYVGVLMALALLYLSVTASTFASQGFLESAVILNTVSSTLLLLFSVGLIYEILVLINVLPAKGSIAMATKNVHVLESRAFWIGIIAWSFVTVSPFAQSVFLPQATTFTQSIGIIPEFWSSFIVNIAAPEAEEVAFLLALPLAVIGLVQIVRKTLNIEILKNPLVEIVLIVLVVSPIFALFHVGQQGIFSFLLVAVIFRAILLTSVFSDLRFDTVKFAALTFPFALGVHMTNNIVSTGGFVKFFGLMLFGAPDAFALFAGIATVFLFLITAIFSVWPLIRGR